MQLNAKLIDGARHFGPLRLVLFQFLLEIREFVRRWEGRACRKRNLRCFPATLTGQRPSGGCRVNNERSDAMLAIEENVP